MGYFGLQFLMSNGTLWKVSGNGTAYVYDATADAYMATRLLIPAPITGYYGVMGAGPTGG